MPGPSVFRPRPTTPRLGTSVDASAVTFYRARTCQHKTQHKAVSVDGRPQPDDFRGRTGYQLKPEILKNVYQKQIRSFYEFAVPVWHSALTGVDRLKIERVQ